VWREFQAQVGEWPTDVRFGQKANIAKLPELLSRRQTWGVR
jgi:hypothetical protein